MNNTKMLKKNYEFRRVFSKGKYYSGDVIEAFVLRNQNSENQYLGLAISTKVGKAFQRNRIKRYLRENYKLLENSLEKGFTIVFLCKKNINIDNINYYTIQRDMNKILIKSKIII